jgi:hypothetical protein
MRGQPLYRITPLWAAWSSGALLFALAVAALAGCADSPGDVIAAPTHSADADPTASPRPPARTLRGGAPDGGAAEPDGPELLLPDLEPLPPRELLVEHDPAAGSRTLRFSTTVANIGAGPLELYGRINDNGTVTASQRFLAADGAWYERVAGTFVFHQGHAHWHFADFTLLEIWLHDDDRELTELVASTGKSTFCAVDEVPLDTDDTEVAAPAYFDCGGDTQGISAGWTDTYGAEIAGQELDISHLDDGRYALRISVDPARRLGEEDESNNSLIVYVELAGDEIRLLDAP